MILAAQLGSPLAAAVPTSEQLGEIANYLETNDVEALRAFLQLHPELLDEDTPLARLLAEFMSQSDDMAGFLGLEFDLRDALRGPASQLPPESSDRQEPPGEVIY
ncbi:MAG: hypothetical protein ABTQ27_01405 [Amaricoccus sp.]